MSTYVMSDLHGEYEMFLEMLEKIEFSSDDTLYIVGDIVDRGPKPITLLKKLLNMDNVILLYGNHDYYAKDELKFATNSLEEEVTEELLVKFLKNIKKMSREMMSFNDWIYNNGGMSTLNEFRALSKEERGDILDALENDFSYLASLVVNNQKYVLVHAGLSNFEKNGDDETKYTWQELLEIKCDYETQISDKVKIITGHTPTQNIMINPNKGYIFRNGCHIAIDCGACFPNGRLACLRLDDNQEFYVERRNN